MEESPQNRRRSVRHQVRIPVLIRGFDVQGRGFFLRGELISIDGHGACLQWRIPLPLGEKVEVQIAEENTVRSFRVAWRGKRGSPEETQAGLEFVDANESWDVEGLVSKWGIGEL